MGALDQPLTNDIANVTIATSHRKLWDICELSVGFALILAVIWTPRPVQHWLYFIAVAWFVASLVFSFPGWKSMGFSITGFWRSMWVVGVALIIAATAAFIASSMGTLHHPHNASGWLNSFGGYAVWSLVQQMLLQGYFFLRLQRILPNAYLAAILAAVVFAIAHLPNPILTPATLVWGLTACLVYQRWRNIYPLAIAHAIFGICIAVTVPAPVIHNMRVGLGYLTYRQPHRRLHLSQSDHTVSTVACVIADAPTRRSDRQALP